MIVSFDLDDTLFVDPDVVTTERAPRFPFNLRFRERLRLGAVDLLLKIRKSGISLWIYTTSFRSEAYIKAYFRHYGVKVDQVVNGDRHQREVQGDRLQPLPSKYPSKYRIDLHVDDDSSVAQNGRVYGFKVFLLKNTDKNWQINVWTEITRIKNRLEPQQR